MSPLIWLKGLASAVISGISSAILSSGYCSVTGTPLSLNQIGSVVIGAAITGACLYLKQSPIPDDNSVTVTQATSTTVTTSPTLKPTADTAGNITIAPANPQQKTL